MPFIFNAIQNLFAIVFIRQNRLPKYTILFCILWNTIVTTHSQEINLDSLKVVLKNCKQDSACLAILNILVEKSPEGEWEKYNKQMQTLAERALAKEKLESNRILYSKYIARSYNNFGYLNQSTGKWKTAIFFYLNAEAILKNINDENELAAVYTNIGSLYYERGEINKGIEYLKKGIEIQKKLGDNIGLGSSYNNMGFIFSKQGDIIHSLEYHNNSLKIRESLNDLEGVATSLNNIGALYDNQGDKLKAQEYYFKSYSTFKKIQNKRGMALCLNNLGVIYTSTNQLPKALQCLFESMKLQEEIGYKSGVALVNQNLGSLYENQKKLEQAIEYYRKALEMYTKLDDNSGIASSQINLGRIYFKSNQLIEAYQYASSALKGANEVGFPSIIRDAALLLKSIYDKKGQCKEAYQMYTLYIEMRDSITNSETRKASDKQQFKYEYEKKSATDSLINVERRTQEQLKYNQEIRQQRLFTYAGIIGFALMLLVAIVSLKAYKNKQRANVIISEQKATVEKQKHLVDEKQKEILDSIRYAKRIQISLLPTEKYIDICLKRLNKG